MNINMEEHNESISEFVLRAIEQMWGYSLPKMYRDFIVKYNGGKFKFNMFNFKGINDGSCVTDFFGIIKDQNNNLLLKQKYAGDRVPENTIPIARDVYGNLIILSVKGKDRGKIYFWDHEMEADEGETPDYSNLTLIADSFDEFINGLYSEENIKDR